MTKEKTLSWYKEKTWDTFSVYIRIRDWNDHGQMFMEGVKAAKCVTCGKVYPVEGKGTMQAGHFIPGRKSEYLFDEKQVYSQCYNCNINLKGNWAAYFDFMVRKFSKAEVYEMMAKKNNYRKYTIPELVDLRESLLLKIKKLT